LSNVFDVFQIFKPLLDRYAEFKIHTTIAFPKVAVRHNSVNEHRCITEHAIPRCF